MDGWMDEWMAGRLMDRKKDGWMEERKKDRGIGEEGIVG
jgi:hypothetical protein